MSALQNIEAQKSYKYLQEVEKVAQDILTAKDNKLQLANAQNKLREAFRALEHIEDRNTFVKVGCVYVEMPTEECKEKLKQAFSSNCLTVKCSEGTSTPRNNSRIQFFETVDFLAKYCKLVGLDMQ